MAITIDQLLFRGKITNLKNELIATGISNYSSEEIEKIKGKKSEEREKISK